MISSLEELFKTLNEKCPYIILRNWENVFDEEIYCSGHEDIDILCEDKEIFLKITKAYRVHNNEYRDNYVVPCGKNTVRFDVRWLGDGYYPKEWERLLLKRRLLKENGIYVPCLEDHFYSLSYHAFFQKKRVSNEYQLKLHNLYCKITGTNLSGKGALFKVLMWYMKEHNYLVSIPRDPAVFLNWVNIKKVGYKRDSVLSLRRYSFRVNSILSHLYLRLRKCIN